MAKFSDAFITTLKDSIPIDDLISRYTHLTFNGSVLVGCCPRPHEHENGVDTKPSFRVIKESNSWFCGACHSGKKDTKSQRGKNFGSDSIAFMQWYHGYTWPKAVKELAKMYNIPIEEDKNQKLYDAQYLRSRSYTYNLTPSIMEYLQRRGCMEQTIQEFMIGYNGRELMIPLVNRQGNHVGFTKRSFDPDEPKYKNSANSKIFNKSYYLFGIDRVDRDHPEIRITEGAFDVIIPTQFGLKNVVGTLGTSFTEHHVDLIRNLGKVPVLCMDGDKAGLKAILRAAALLAAHGVYCKVLILPEGKDLADLANELGEGIEEYVSQNAIPYGSYLLQSSLKEYESHMDELNKRYISEFKSALSQIKDPDEKKIMLDRIRRNTGLYL